MPLSLIITLIGLGIFTIVVLQINEGIIAKQKKYTKNEDKKELLSYKSKQQLSKMHHREFEYFAAKFLQLTRNFEAEVTKATKDGGKDIIAFDDDEKIYVEVKHWKGNVGRPAIQKLNGAMLADHVKRGYFITSSGFTKDALEYANKTNITLIDGNELIRQLHT
jgi:restriction system protein